MTALILFAFSAIQGTQAMAVGAPGIDLRAWHMEADSAIASTALPASGTLELSNSRPTLLDAASGAVNPMTGGSHLRKLLADFSMTLQNIRYRRGGRDPKSGFDCSGFVHYVFSKSVGADLPSDSASQYRYGNNVARADMKVGDLVFFKIRGQRISHVGIYLGEGRFIHSPSTGKTVSISRLDEAYWSHRFAGAKRPNVLS
ncbi:C40 family peptidase [Dokdonella sp.]|uniref:C40 family peptidase n=1 Tax=Dokdonella sp. TaxID=2291710 RepID=UPI0037842F34